MKLVIPALTRCVSAKFGCEESQFVDKMSAVFVDMEFSPASANSQAAMDGVCDDWETVKHRTQILSRMYEDGELAEGRR